MFNIEEIEIMDDLDHDYETPIRQAEQMRAYRWRWFKIGLVFAAVDLIGIAYLITR